MTPQAARTVRLCVALLTAALVQLAIVVGLNVRGVHPDLLLATALLCAMFSAANGGAALGFSAGLIHACFAAPPLAASAACWSAVPLSASVSAGWKSASTATTV